MIKPIFLSKNYQYKANEFLPRYENINPLDFYDIIVDINSIKSIKNGWDIKMNERGKKFYKNDNDDCVKIGVIGNGNKGKSFLLSKISEIDLPVGESIKTKGLIIKFPELKLYKNRTIILLDSAGQETPVLNYEKSENNKTPQNINVNSNENIEIKNDYKTKEEKLTEKSRDKLLTEFFLQNYIAKYSDLLILVVGLLTFSEQKLINKIKKTHHQLKKKSPLIIVHNFQTFVTIEQVKNYIEDTLLKSDTFDLNELFLVSKKRKKIEWSYYNEKNSITDTIHLIFARDGSEAGNFYNFQTIEHIYTLINALTKKERLNLYENIKDLLFKLSSQILETPLKEEDIIQEENKIKLKEEKNQTDLKLKKCSIDELGLNYFSSNGFDPSYCYYIDKNTFNIICEVPGLIDKKNFECVADIQNGICNIKISGTKLNDIENIENSNILAVIKRDFGTFNLNLKIQDANIDIDSGKIINENGLIKIKYNLKVSKSLLKFE